MKNLQTQLKTETETKNKIIKISKINDANDNSKINGNITKVRNSEN